MKAGPSPRVVKNLRLFRDEQMFPIATQNLWQVLQGPNLHGESVGFALFPDAVLGR